MFYHFKVLLILLSISFSQCTAEYVALNVIYCENPMIIFPILVDNDNETYEVYALDYQDPIAVKLITKYPDISKHQVDRLLKREAVPEWIAVIISKGFMKDVEGFKYGFPKKHKK